MTNVVALNAYPIYDKNNFEPLVEINNIFHQTKAQPLSYLNTVGEDPWKTVVPDGRHLSNEYSEDTSFEGIGQFQSNGNRSYQNMSYENYVDSQQYLDMKGTGFVVQKIKTGVIAPKKFIKVNKKTGRKYITKDIISKY